MYAVGRGVTANQKEAVTWLQRSPRQEYDYAQNELASRYALIRGGPRNHETACTWFELGASSAPSSVANIMLRARDALTKKLTVGKAFTSKGVSEQV